MRSYTDEQLAVAIRSSRSWRGTLRALGLKATSASAMRSVRRRAEDLGITYGHFTGARRWDRDALAAAVAASATWPEVAENLGLSGGSSTTTLKGHAARLGLATDHLDAGIAAAMCHDVRPRIDQLRRSGPLHAAAWFQLCGMDVSWPLEPCRYDLLVWRAGAAERVQVKTATFREGSSWRVSLVDKRGRPYDPDDVDSFFVIDADLRYYWLPASTVGGLAALHLSAYESYVVEQTLTPA